jgi:peptidoglycan/xylan/chitin deacetylase (PgdA/CDA1 family)
MTETPEMTLPLLPLLLYKTPPGLELILTQEGVSHRSLSDLAPPSMLAGRFVLYDGRVTSRDRLKAMLTPEHFAIDVDQLRGGESADPFASLIDNESRMASWNIGGALPRERISRQPKGRIRRTLIDRLRRTVGEAGGLWARLGSFPYPYRSAFNFRADLDESVPDDYWTYANARRPIEDCTTHFVSTRAYGDCPAVLDDLRDFDAQSHGHYHVISRDPDTNRKNLRRAHRLLVDAGIRPTGFASPHGRWNAGLDDLLEELGYDYSSEFQIGYDDLPFFPWKGDRFSGVLQLPIHPVCEGIMLEAGVTGGADIADHLARVVRAKIEAGEPAFVYGHPEHRLCRYPMVLRALAETIEGEPFVWRATMTAFADWWRWRSERPWSVVARGPGRYEVMLEGWSSRYPLGIEVYRGDHIARLPIDAPRVALNLAELAYERSTSRADIPHPTPAPRELGWRNFVREALDWETVTPLSELPASTLTGLVKRELRRWRDRDDSDSLALERTSS